MRQDAAKLVDDVPHDVHSRTLDARRRNGHASRLSEVRHIAQPQSNVTLWERLKLSFTSEILDVAGRVVKGFVVPHWAAGVLLAAILAAGGAMYRSMSGQIADQGKVINSQNELLIRLDQRLIDKGTNDRDRFEKLERKFDSVEAWQGVTNKEIVKLQSGRK